MEDINAWKEQALIRQHRAASMDDWPTMTPEVRMLVNTDASTFASGRMTEHESGYGMFNSHKTLVGGQNGHYPLNRAISRGRAAAVCALCGSDGHYSYLPSAWPAIEIAE